MLTALGTGDGAPAFEPVDYDIDWDGGASAGILKRWQALMEDAREGKTNMRFQTRIFSDGDLAWTKLVPIILVLCAAAPMMVSTMRESGRRTARAQLAGMTRQLHGRFPAWSGRLTRWRG